MRGEAGSSPSPQVLASGPLIENGGFASRSLDSPCIGCSGPPRQPSESTHAEADGVSRPNENGPPQKEARASGGLDRGARVARLGWGANNAPPQPTRWASDCSATRRTPTPRRHASHPPRSATTKLEAPGLGCPCDAGRIQRTGETAYPTPSSPTAYSRQRDRAIRIAVRSAVVPSG
jgi:hypothetical protein